MARQQTTARKRVGKGGSLSVRVLIVSHYFPPHHGGIENVAYSQAKILAERGHIVTVVTSALPKIADLQGMKFKVIQIPAWNILENKLGVPYPIFSPALFKTIKKEAKVADIIHAHGHVYMPSVVAARYAKRYKKPLVLTQHNTFIEYKSRSLRTVQNVADKSLGKYTLYRSVKIITVSDATKDYINSIIPGEAVVQYNGVDIDRFKPAQSQELLRKDLKLPTNKIICFTIRRITFKNGIDTMIETARLLREQKDILFVIGGKGPDLPRAEALVKKLGLKNIILLGAVSEEDLPKYYAASNIFILPSKKGEGFPLVILEALASALPVIATRSGGHVEIIENTDRGFIVDPDRPDEIAEHIQKMAKDPLALRDTSALCRLFAESDLSWDKNVAKLINIYEGVRT